MNHTFNITAFPVLLFTNMILVSPASAVPRPLIRKAIAEERRESTPARVVAPDVRLAVMEGWIARGTAKGKLTKAESGLLSRELAAVKEREARYRRSMDKFTAGERRKLQADITDLHERIRQKTQNGAKS